MARQPKVLAFAREAGGAAAIAPVLLALRQEATVLVLAKDYAHAVFRRAGLTPVTFAEFSEAMLCQRFLQEWDGQLPDVVFTSATSLPQLDMTEKYLWHWARQQRIPSVAVLDQWQNYALRFSGLGPEEHLGYIPDWIAAMDERAKHGLVAEGLPAERVVVTGQPAFDRLAQLRDAAPSDHAALRRELGMAPQGKLVCFVSESFADVFGDRLGYTEQSVLRDLLGVCGRVVSDAGLSVHLAVKLHPQNLPNAFAWLRAATAPQGLGVSLHGPEQPPIPLLLASDVVIGMTSVLLIESILLGRPTISFQPGAKQTTNLVATVIEAIPLLDTPEACGWVLRALLEDPRFTAAYLRRQVRLGTAGGATARVVDLVRRASVSAAATSA